MYDVNLESCVGLYGRPHEMPKVPMYIEGGRVFPLGMSASAPFSLYFFKQ